jgi:hypothetical protein
MGLIVIASAKGRPGVTTAALLLAGLWPRAVLFAEADPSGGDVALRLPAADGRPLRRATGLLSLAAVARRGLEPGQVSQHVQRLRGGLDVLVGVEGPEQLDSMHHELPRVAAVLDALPGTDVLADCGRFTGHPGQLALVRAARLLVLVCRPDTADVVHLRERVARLEPLLRPRAIDGIPVAALVVAPPAARSAVEDVRVVLAARCPGAVRQVWQLADDPRAASALSGGSHRSSPRLDRSLLVRSARPIATAMSALVSPVPSCRPAVPA